MFSLWRFASTTILCMVATKLTKQRWAMRCVCFLWRVSLFYTETSRWLQKCIWPSCWVLRKLAFGCSCSLHTLSLWSSLLCCLCCVVWLEMSPTDLKCLQQISREHIPPQSVTFPPLVNRARNRNFSFATGVWLLNTTTCWHQNSQDYLQHNSVLGFLSMLTLSLSKQNENIPVKKTNCATMFTNLSIQCKIKENCEIMYHQKGKWDL